MKRKGRGFPLEYYPGEILTDTEARKNRKLVIVYVKKKVIAGVIVVYVVAKIFTGLNKIEDQGQSQTLAVSTKPVIERVVYQPYGSIFDEYRPSGLYMSHFERPSLVPQHSHSQRLISELRAGNLRVREAAWLSITIWMLQQQSVGFQPINPPINPAPMPPQIESARNLLFGKPKPDQLSCRQDQSRFQTQLDMGRSRRSRSVRQINMDEEYQKFLLIKHPETDCSQERFESLCTDPQRNTITDASIKETIIILECEGRGIVQGVERPNLDNGEPNLDFKVNGPGNYKYVDVKEPRNYGRGNQDLDSAARNMGYKINKQKDQSEYGISRKEILHIVNFELLDPGERPEYQTNIFSPHGSEDITIIDISKRN